MRVTIQSRKQQKIRYRHRLHRLYNYIKNSQWCRTPNTNTKKNNFVVGFYIDAKDVKKVIDAFMNKK